MNKPTQKKENNHMKARASKEANAQVDPDVLYQQQLNERYYINPLLHNQHTQEDLARIREKLVTLILATHENLYGGDLGNSHDGIDGNKNKSSNNKSNTDNNVCNVNFNKPIDTATFPAVQVYKLPYLLNACGLHLSNEQVNQIAAMTTHKLLKSYLVNINNNNSMNSNESDNYDANNLQEWHKENSKVESMPTTDSIDLEKLVNIIHEIHMNGFFTYVPESLEPNNTKQDDNTVKDEDKKKTKNKAKKEKSKKSLQKSEPEETTCKQEKSLLLHMTDNTLQQVFEVLWIACGKQTREPELSEIDKTPVRCIHKAAMWELFTHKLTSKNQKSAAVDKENNNNTNEQPVNDANKEVEDNKADLDSNNDTSDNNNNRSDNKWTSVSSLLMNDKFSANVMTQEEIENFLFHCTDASGEWIYESVFLERLHDVQN